mmetsp:Transcript_57723/g.108164  ORF Transcript_57723/g.108164 Transcript_57723/m.108164 type:complete len:86 (-) Transcript_57723:575-832(-)
MQWQSALTVAALLQERMPAVFRTNRCSLKRHCQAKLQASVANPLKTLVVIYWSWCVPLYANHLQEDKTVMLRVYQRDQFTRPSIC